VEIERPNSHNHPSPIMSETKEYSSDRFSSSPHNVWEGTYPHHILII